MFPHYLGKKNNLEHSTLRLPWWLSSKESSCQRRRCRFNPWVRKISWRKNGNPLQYSCLINPMDRGAWQPTVHGVTRVKHDLVTKPPPVYKNKMKQCYFKWFNNQWINIFLYSWILPKNELLKLFEILNTLLLFKFYHNTCHMHRNIMTK